VADEIIRGGRELNDFLQQLTPKIEKNIMRAAMRAGANVFLREARANIPVVEGDLRKSARVSTKSKGGRVSASLKLGGKKAPHAHLVEFGTKPHEIKPKNTSGALAINGTFVRVVHHPGARPHPIMRPAFDSQSGVAIEAVAAKIRERLTAQGIDVPAPETE
jgi:HK97 gp10 family phage protein